MRKYLKVSPLVLFLLLIIATVLVLYLIQVMVLNSMNIKGALNQTDTSLMLSLISIHEMPFWMISLFAIQFITIRTFAISVCVIIGLYVANIKFKLWNVIELIMLAQFIFVLQYITELIWFFIFHKTVTIEVVEHYNPFSFASVFSVTNTTEWYYCILDSVNIFDILFFLLFPLLLNGVVFKEYHKNLLFVVATYGFGFLAWLLLVTLHSLY